MLVHTTLLISKMDPIKYIFKNPALSRKVVHWKWILTEYNIQYVTHKAIKGSIFSDYLSHQPMDDYQPMKFEFLDEDFMCIINEGRGVQKSFLSLALNGHLCLTVPKMR